MAWKSRTHLIVRQPPVDLEVHHRLPVQCAASRPDRRDRTILVALHAHHRMHHHPHLQAAAAQLLADGVDQEGRILRVRLDHGAVRDVAIPLPGRVQRPHRHVAATAFDEGEQASHLCGQLGQRRPFHLVDANAAGVGSCERRQAGVGTAVQLDQQRRDQLGIRVAGRGRDGRGCLAAHEL
jgi:hypothetical protein